jgi:hypothetical protein
VGGQVVHGRTDDLPGVGQRVADDGDEAGVVELAARCGVEDGGGNVEGHGFLQRVERTSIRTGRGRPV